LDTVANWHTSASAFFDMKIKITIAIKINKLLELLFADILA